VFFFSLFSFSLAREHLTCVIILFFVDFSFLASDCSSDEYCDTTTSPNAGTCTSFDKEGNDCRPLSSGQLVDPAFPDDWKCAVVCHEARSCGNCSSSGVCVCVFFFFSRGVCVFVCLCVFVRRHAEFIKDREKIIY
jgi:hypothetical protein